MHRIRWKEQKLMRQDHNNTNSYIGLACFTYIKGISEHLAKILMKAHIKRIFLPLNKLEGIFKFVKDNLEPLQHKGVYKLYVSIELVTLVKQGIQ